MLDILIKNAEIIDGSGAKAQRGDLGIRDGKLVTAAAGEGAAKIIDADGLCVCPGFIDSHSHGDEAFGSEYGNRCKTTQGITTQITGECGTSCFPVSEDAEKAELFAGFIPQASFLYGEKYREFTSFRKYIDYISTLDHTVNFAQLVGQGALRLCAMGFDDRKPTEAEMQKMKTILGEAMEDGALGMSSGLIYSPSGFADTDELAELCSVMRGYDGIYTTHMRNEAEDVVRSVADSIEVARRAGVRLNISHHKVCGQKNWGLSEKTLKLIDEAVGQLPDIWLDQYPYTASCTSLNVCMPREYFTKGVQAMKTLIDTPEKRAVCAEKIRSMDGRYNHCGGFDGILVASAAGFPECEGMTVSEYAKKTGKEPFDAFFDILCGCDCKATAIYFMMDEGDLLRIASHERTVIGTDGIADVMGPGSHPRAFGAFPRAIDLFWRQKQLMPLESIIKKMTSEPARHFMLAGKGLIRDGYDADLVIFDKETIRDKADYMHPQELSEGIEYVINGGQIVYHDKQLTGNAPGRFIAHRSLKNR